MRLARHGTAGAGRGLVSGADGAWRDPRPVVGGLTPGTLPGVLGGGVAVGAVLPPTRAMAADPVVRGIRGLAGAGEIVAAVGCPAFPAVGSTTGIAPVVDGGMDKLRLRLRKEG
ncbi:hypothetical protein ACFRI7_25130 [Streptomyces sp. NPDC056716]|uniref:hypothetical protein n=1 Tax=unclassified Streptomyces TaxID=2593676 RepID=UPI003678F49C